jgi:competence protein ComEA
VLLFLAAASVLLAQQPDMPEGNGREIIQRTCTKCHDAYHYATVFATRQTWEKTIDTMIQRGANLQVPESRATVIDYFARYFGVTANVNDDTAKELETKLELPQAEAEAIVKYRAEKGDFRTYRDLRAVPGLDITKLDPIKLRLRY